jgi:hemolysin-activating ACP:hemolysin acyltransferase
MSKNSLEFFRDGLMTKRIEAVNNCLTAVEWKSGTHMCIVDVVGLFGHESE